MELHTLLEDEKSRLTAQKLKLQKRIKEAEFQLRKVQVRLHHVEGLLGLRAKVMVWKQGKRRRTRPYLV